MCTKEIQENLTREPKYPNDFHGLHGGCSTLGSKVRSQVLKKLERGLWDLSHSFSEKHSIVWLPVICPKCLALLSQKTASTRLTCLACGQEWTLMEAAGDE